MYFVKENIEKLTKGEVVLHYAGGDNGFELKFLIEVLRKAFPKAGKPSGTSHYYYCKSINSDTWVSANSNFDNRPVFDLKDFIAEKPKCPEGFEFGDTILVRDNELQSWNERIFLAYVGGETPYIVTAYSDLVGDFESGTYTAIAYKFAEKKVNKVKLTRREIADKFGVADFEIAE